MHRLLENVEFPGAVLGDCEYGRFSVSFQKRAETPSESDVFARYEFDLITGGAASRLSFVDSPFSFCIDCRIEVWKLQWHPRRDLSTRRPVRNQTWYCSVHLTKWVHDEV